MSTTFQHHFKICLLWCLDEKWCSVSNYVFLLLYWNKMNVYPFNCHLSYRLRYCFSCKLTSSEGFQHNFKIVSKKHCCGFYMKKNVAFTLISFAVLKWDECLSVQLPFELPFEIPFQLHLELELNLLDQNVNELESRM